jgi:hypothetical protein
MGWLLTSNRRATAHRGARQSCRTRPPSWPRDHQWVSGGTSPAWRRPWGWQRLQGASRCQQGGAARAALRGRAGMLTHATLAATPRPRPSKRAAGAARGCRRALSGCGAAWAAGPGPGLGAQGRAGHGGAAVARAPPADELACPLAAPAWLLRALSWLFLWFIIFELSLPVGEGVLAPVGVAGRALGVTWPPSWLLRTECAPPPPVVEGAAGAPPWLLVRLEPEATDEASAGARGAAGQHWAKKRGPVLTLGVMRAARGPPRPPSGAPAPPRHAVTLVHACAAGAGGRGAGGRARGACRRGHARPCIVESGTGPRPRGAGWCRLAT